MRRTGLVLLTSLAIAGCGAQSSRTPEIPASAIGVAPETARRPEGSAFARPPGFTFPNLVVQIPSIDRQGLSLIEGFEGFSSCPYYDGYGHVWTRGFGETDFYGNFGGRCITRSFGEANLAGLIRRNYEWAVRSLGVSENVHQVDALDSFVYNLGPYIFQINPGLRFSLQHHNPYPLLSFDRAGGVVLAGLARRRREEVALYLTRVHEESAAERHARKVRELRAAEAALGSYKPPRGLRGRINVLRAYQLRYGCIARRHHHRALGARCRRWFREGDAAHARGLALDRLIAQRHREGLR